VAGRIDAILSEMDRALAIVDGLPNELNSVRVYETAGGWYRRKGDLVAPAPESREWYRKSLAILLRGVQVDAADVDAKRRADLAKGKQPVAAGWFPVYLELGRTYLRLSDPAHALEALEHGRQIQMTPDVFDELALAHLAMGDSRGAEMSLWEGAVANPGNPLPLSRLAVLFRETEPRSCAVMDSGVNLECPLVKEERCLALANMATLRGEKGRAAAAEARKGAIGTGCGE